jgi:mRNA interferase RelE/StbE
MKYRIFLERRAYKQLESLDKGLQKRIKDRLKLLEQEGFSLELDIKKLKGYRNQYRLRIGEYRILFEIQKKYTLVVHAILPRKSAY